MKVHIELLDDGTQDEVIIRCRRVDETVKKIQRFIEEQAGPPASFTFYKGNEEFYFPVDRILFFETEGEYVYGHTQKDAYRIKYRLYELEQVLPPYFIRSSKSAIVNSRQVYSITKNLTASSLVTFKDTHKHVYVSRHYYQPLRRLMRKE